VLSRTSKGESRHHGGGNSNGSGLHLVGGTARAQGKPFKKVEQRDCPVGY